MEISNNPSNENKHYANSVEKQQHKTKSKKPLLIAAIIGLVFLIAGGVFLAFALQSDFNIKSFTPTRIIGYRTEYKEDFGNICYGNFFGCSPVEISSDGAVNPNEIGSYKIVLHIKYQDHTKRLEQIVEVKDLESPVIETSANKVTVCPSGKVAKFDYKITDNIDGDLTDKAEFDVINDRKVRLKIRDSSGNLAEKLFEADLNDTAPPTITLNGNAEMTVLIGNQYNDPGATATDNCDDEIAVQVDSKVNTNAVGTYEVIYTATDQAGNKAEAKRIVKVDRTVAQPNGKIVYLTFDDGPSGYTDRLLDVLKQYNVKATFFVTGAGPDDAIRRAYNEGHAIGLHTFTHTYAHVYQSDAVFMDDLYKIQNRVKNLTGGYISTLMRFPGGSSNTVSRSYSKGIMSRLVNTVTQNGFTYFDWNVSSGDAGGATTADQVYNNVVNTLKDGRSIVLQHDTKGFSVDAVERIIQYGQSHGYTFARLEPGYWGAHHGVNN